MTRRDTGRPGPPALIGKRLRRVKREIVLIGRFVIVRGAFDRFINRMKYQYLKARSLNLSTLDDKIEKRAKKIATNNGLEFHIPVYVNDTRIAYLATVLYDVGGHTECLKNLVVSFSDIFEQRIFINTHKDLDSRCPKKLQVLKQHATVDIQQLDGNGTEDKLIDVFTNIVEYGPKVVVSFSHTDDPFNTACIALLKSAGIHVFAFNHASHKPSLGFNFADLIVEGMNVTQYVTNEFRDIGKTKVLGLQSRPEEDTVYFTEVEKASFRKMIGIKEGSSFTLTGCSIFKLFEGPKSRYFNMVRNLLESQPNLQHVVISDISKHPDLMESVETVFRDAKSARERLIFMDFFVDYDLLFQSCDLFIDSFPMGSALTLIDLMRNKVPVVTIRNPNDSLMSFHEYLPPDYQFIFNDIDSAARSIINILQDDTLRIAAVDDMYEHYLHNYESSAFASRYRKLIDDVNSIHEYYERSERKPDYVFRGLIR